MRGWNVNVNRVLASDRIPFLKVFSRSPSRYRELYRILWRICTGIRDSDVSLIDLLLLLPTSTFQRENSWIRKSLSKANGMHLMLGEWSYAASLDMTIWQNFATDIEGSNTMSTGCSNRYYQWSTIRLVHTISKSECTPSVQSKSAHHPAGFERFLFLWSDFKPVVVNTRLHRPVGESWKWKWIRCRKKGNSILFYFLLLWILPPTPIKIWTTTPGIAFIFS